MHGGTTSTETAWAIGARSALTPRQTDGVAFTIVTNALDIACEPTARSPIKIVVTGGVASSSSYELIGPLAADMLDQLHLDVALLGVDAVDPEWGAMTRDEGEAMIYRVDVVVTDDQVMAELVKRFTAAGVRVITG
jgi:DeoR family transcriptional regulator, aga operon transcriptional repressor